MKDGTWFSRSVVERLAAMRAPPKSGRGGAALGDLTPRERDVLSLISLGLPDAEIAERLGLSRSTIRNHLSTLYSKIDVKNRGSAIIWARERCLNVTAAADAAHGCADWSRTDGSRTDGAGSQPAGAETRHTVQPRLPGRA